MNKLTEFFDRSQSKVEYVTDFCNHMASVVQSLDKEAIAALIDVVEETARENRTVFLAANGGSAAVAGHWVNDLSANSVFEGQPGFRVISLTDNAYSVTAIANDASFEEIFSIQLAANMRPHDLLIAMSVSGNSPNIVRAVEYANTNECYTVGCTGMDGGKLKDISKLSIHMPSTKDEYGPVEDVFSIVMHIVTGYITMKRGRMLCH